MWKLPILYTCYCYFKTFFSNTWNVGQMSCRPNVLSAKCLVGEMSCRQNVRRPNVCRQNVRRPNVCRQNVRRPNVCRPNVCRLIVRAPIHTKHIKRYIYKLYKKYLKYSSSFKTIGPCMLCIDRNAAFLKWFSCRTVITFPLEIHGNTEHKQLGLLYK